MLFWLVMILRVVALVLFSMALARSLRIRPKMVSTEARGLITFVALTAAVFVAASVEEVVVATTLIRTERWQDSYGWLELALVLLLVPLAGYGLRAMHEFSHGLDRRLTALDILSNRSDFELPALDLQALTARERELVHLLVDGTTSDEDLARKLSISPSTAATHVRNILRKTGMNSRQQLTIAGAAAMGRLGQD